MALSTQILVLCLCSFVADSYLFIYNGRVRHPLNPFDMIAGIFQDHPGGFSGEKPPYTIYKDKPFTTAYVTTQKNKIPEPVTTTGPCTTPVAEDVALPEEVTEEDNFLMHNVKVNGPLELLEEKDKVNANTLSIHEDQSVKTVPILSVTIDDKKPDNAEDVEIEIKPDNENDTQTITTTKVSTEKSNETSVNKEEPVLSKNTDYLIIPVNAINPSPSLPVNNSPLTPMTNNDNMYNQAQHPVNQNSFYGNGVNRQVMNQGPQGNDQPRYTTTANAVPPMNNYPNNINNYLANTSQGNNGPNNLYYLPNNPNQLNNGYPQSNFPQLYNLVPVQNLPNTGVNQNNVGPYNYNNQPTDFVPYNNNYVPNQPNYVPINNNPQNVMPYNNPNNNYYPNLRTYSQPNNVIPINNNPNNFVPLNNPPNNFIPANSGSVNFVPLNNVPNTYTPINNNMPMNTNINFVPINNSPNNFPDSYVPVNNNNLIPIYNQPNNFVATRINNVPNDNYPNNVGPMNNINFVPNNVAPLQYAPLNFGANGSPNNFAPYKEQSNGNVSSAAVVIPVEPVGTVFTFKEEEKKNDDDKVDIEKIN